MAVEQERQAFWASVGQDLASAAELPGSIRSPQKAPTFADRDRMVYAAATARRDGEIKALREELADAKRQLLGIVRPPLNGGRSAPTDLRRERVHERPDPWRRLARLTGRGSPSAHNDPRKSRGTDPTYSTSANGANALIPVEVQRGIVQGMTEKRRSCAR